MSLWPAARLAALLAVALAFAFLAGPVQAQYKPVFPDAVITADVERALDTDPVLRRADIAVQTHYAVVSLTGFVRSVDDIVRAGVLARGIDGVAGLRNGLRVANRPSRAALPAAAGRTRS